VRGILRGELRLVGRQFFEGKIEFVVQVATQAPQSMQSSGLMNNWVAASKAGSSPVG